MTAAPAHGDAPTEESGGTPLPSAEDRLLLACCRAIRRETGWHHRTLRAACDWALGELERSRHPGAGLGRYYRVVELGMESPSEDVVEVALAQLHKLIAAGLVRHDTMTTLKDGTAANLADILVEVILFTGSTDKTVRRGGRAQAVKCLLSCVTSSEIQVHGQQLRRVYAFVLNTFVTIDSTAIKAKQNKAQARATLDHILQVIFSRLEMESPAPSRHGRVSDPRGSGAIEALLSPKKEVETLFPEGSGSGGEDDESQDAEEVAETGPTETRTTGESVTEAALDDVALAEDTPESSPDHDGHGRTTNDASDGRGVEGSAASNGRHTLADALMLLSTLCRWSLSDEQHIDERGTRESETKMLESKSVSLELIVAVLRTYGGARFRALPAAALFVRNELCPALLHHCTSGVTELVSLSLRVFVALVKGFKNHLKAEIEVFITSIFLRILESENSAFDHKMLVLEAISGFCRDPVALVEIFVNYDCDLQAIDLFKRIVTALTKVAKGRSVPDGAGKKDIEEERLLQLLGMGGTVDIVASMVKAADLEVLDGDMAMAPRRGSIGKRIESATSELGPSASPVRRSNSARMAAIATTFRNSPTSRSNSASAAKDGSPYAFGLPSGSGGGGSSSRNSGRSTPPLTPRNRGTAESDRTPTLAMSATWSGSGQEGSATAGFRRQISTASMGVEKSGSAASGMDDTRPKSTRTMDRASLRLDGQGQSMQAFDTKRRVQREIEAGIIKFNQKPKDGLAYLHSKGHVDKNDPVSVAAFLRQQADRLDKTEIGEFMGRGAEYMNGFCVKVLHAYVDGMDFTDMLFDEAIRHFLSGFRLPGEAQKIDRMMEKFAERFCLQNGTVFPNPDTAFILAFSIVMLNTDLHNPSIADAKRMTKEGFIRNNRGIDQGKSLPDELLAGVFDRIARSPISLKEDDRLRRAAEGGSHATTSLQEMLPFTSARSSQSSKRVAAHNREREEMLKSSRALLTKPRGVASSSKRYTHLSIDAGKDGFAFVDMAEHVRLMYEITWGPVLSVFSEVLESSDDPELIGRCLEGFKKTVRIAGGLDIAVARETLLNALVRFTLLEASRRMEDKNVRCVKVLLSLALTDGNLLKESWGLVLRCISQLARLQSFASDLEQDESVFAGERASQKMSFPSVKDSGSSQGQAGKHQRRATSVALSAHEEVVEVAGSGRQGLAVEEEDGGKFSGGQHSPEVRAETTASADWRSDLMSAFRTTKVKSASKEAAGDTSSSEALEQVMRYVKEREAFLVDRKRKEREKAMGELASFFMGPTREAKERVVEAGNATTVVGQVDQALIDRVFSATTLLNREAMQHFVEQLIQVSQSEIPQLFGRRTSTLGVYQRQEGVLKGGAAKPRTFSMQKLVEVAHLNMDVRSRIEWASMWGALADHFGTVGSITGFTTVAMYTVDCLRQLALKFLDKDERRDFNFQRVFLGPFATIFKNSREASIRELVVSCLNNVILAKGKVIRSGWKTLLTVLRAAAGDKEEEVVQPACSILQRLSSEDFSLVQYDFVDLIYTLLEMSSSRFLDVSLACIGHLRLCARELAEGGVDVTLQRPLPEATVSNTGQVPAEVLDTVEADHEQPPEAAKVRPSRLTLQVDQLHDGDESAVHADHGHSPPQGDGHVVTIPNNDEAASTSGRPPAHDGFMTPIISTSMTGWVSPPSTASAPPSAAKSSGGGVASTGRAGIESVEPAEHSRLALKLWWPLLAGLADGAGDARLDCRAASIFTLQDLLKEYGSAPAFSPRVWPLLLTRVMLPAMRHANKMQPGSALAPIPSTPSTPTPLQPSTPSSHNPYRSSFALSSASPRSTAAGGLNSPAPPPRIARAAPPLLPSSRGVLFLDVGSWVHTTAPQLLRASAIVVAGNARVAAPLGVPTLMAFLEACVCCGPCPDGGPREGLLSPFVDGDDGDEHHVERGWGQDINTAAAAGASVADEAGVTGDGLTSRIALEALGLLIEGLAGQQVPHEVYAFMCSSLVRMTHLCLPPSFGPGLRSLRSGVSAPSSPGPPSMLKSKSGGGGARGVAATEDSVAGARGNAYNASRGGRSFVEADSLDEPDSGGGAAVGPGGGGGPSSGREDNFSADSRQKVSAPSEGVLPRDRSAGELDEGREGSAAEQHAGGSSTAVALARGLSRGDSMTLSDDGGDLPERVIGGERSRTFWPCDQQPGSGQTVVENSLAETPENDGARINALLAAALRLQRAMYGLARLHLQALGEKQARSLLGGISAGVRYARAFQAQHGARMSLFAAGLLGPKSGPASQELPHLLDQEREGVCYMLAVAFRLLDVRWPLASPTDKTDGDARSSRSSGSVSGTKSIVEDGGNSASDVDLAPWPDPRAFEADAPVSLPLSEVVPEAPRRDGGNRPQTQPRRARPPRPHTIAAGRETLSGGSGSWRLTHAGSVASASAPPAPVLVVDDLMDWSGRGDEGPAGSSVGGIEEGEGEQEDKEEGGRAALEGGGLRWSRWDGTTLARDVLRAQGSALLKRYFLADGEVQRGSFGHDAGLEDGHSSPSPVSSTPASPSRSAFEAEPSPSRDRDTSVFASEGSTYVPSHSRRGRHQTDEHSHSVKGQMTASTPSAHRPGLNAAAKTGSQPRVVNIAASREAEVRHLTPGVLLLLRGLLRIKQPEAFTREVGWLYPCLADLVVVRSLEVRAAVRELLARISPLLRVPSEDGAEQALRSHS